MKKLIVTLAALLITVSTFAADHVTVLTRGKDSARVVYDDVLQETRLTPMPGGLPGKVQRLSGDRRESVLAEWAAQGYAAERGEAYGDAARRAAEQKRAEAAAAAAADLAAAERALEWVRQQEARESALADAREAANAKAAARLKQLHEDNEKYCVETLALLCATRDLVRASWKCVSRRTVGDTVVEVWEAPVTKSKVTLSDGVPASVEEAGAALNRPAWASKALKAELSLVDKATEAVAKVPSLEEALKLRKNAL